MRSDDYAMGPTPVPPPFKPKRPLIIDRPDLQSGQQRALYHVLTAAFWVLWVVLWLPLITLLGWFFFGYQFHFHMIKMEGYVGFLDVLGAYALVIAIMTGSLMIWAKYNHLRFRGVDRREGIAPPLISAIADVHGQSAADMRRWQSASIVTVHHDAEGRILRVDA